MVDPEVPPRLRWWFQVHCVVDLLFAVPLMIAPVTMLSLLGWTTIDPLATRLVAAAAAAAAGAAVSATQTAAAVAAAAAAAVVAEPTASAARAAVDRSASSP